MQALASASKKSLETFVKSAKFHKLLSVFQSDEDVLTCLCRIYTLCPVAKKTTTPLINTLSTCFAKSTTNDCLSSIVAALKHSSAHQQLHDIATNLKSVLAEFEDSSIDVSHDDGDCLK